MYCTYVPMFHNLLWPFTNVSKQDDRAAGFQLLQGSSGQGGYLKSKNQS